MGQHLRNKEHAEIQKELRIGDLVVYKNPRKFFSGNKGRDIIGVITKADFMHAKVYWDDGLWCLESFEDLSVL